MNVAKEEKNVQLLRVYAGELHRTLQVMQYLLDSGLTTEAREIARTVVPEHG